MPELKEEWRDIEGYEGLYQVSSLGRVKSLNRKVRAKNNSIAIKKGKILKPVHHHSGYLVVSLRDYKSKLSQKSIHRLVAKAFILNPENKMVVNHINGIKTDNSISNLEWNTPAENTAHANLTGLTDIRGEKNINSKLTTEQIRQIRQEYVKGSNTHGTTSLAQKYKVSQRTIYLIVNKVSYKNVT